MNIIGRLLLASVAAIALLSCSKKGDDGIKQISSQQSTPLHAENTVVSDSARKRMPLDQDNIAHFVERLGKRTKKVEAGSDNEWTISNLSKEVIESMGFNYEKTLVYYILKVAPTGGPVAQQLTTIFGPPFLNPSGAFDLKLISVKTRDFFNLLNTTSNYDPQRIPALIYLVEKYGTNVITAKQVSDGLAELQTKKELSGELAELNYKDDLKTLWLRIEYNLSILDVRFTSARDTHESYLEIRDVEGLKKLSASGKKVKALTAEMEAFFN